MVDDRFATEESGEGLSELDGKISDFFFSNNNWGGASICVKIAFDDPGLPQYVRFAEGVYTQWYKMGDDFTSPDGGATIEGPEKWKRNSDAGRLLTALGEVPGISDALPGDWTKDKAANWVGLHLHWERQTYGYKKYKRDGDSIVTDDQGKKILEDATGSILVPIALLGTASSNGSKAGVDIASLGLTLEQSTAVSKAADAAGTPGEFLAAMNAIPGVMSNQALMSVLVSDTEGVRAAFAAELI